MRTDAARRPVLLRRHFAPQYTAAFVADRAGAFTVLPMPANPNEFAWRASYGYGINSCGVVVGTGWAFPGHPYTAQPMVWDPGC